MKHLCHLSQCFCLAAIVAAGATAHAETFNFTITGVLNGSGTLTAVPDPTIAGAFDVTSISGTIAGGLITGLLPCPDYRAGPACDMDYIPHGWDNLIYPDGVPPLDLLQLDTAGIGFTTDGASGVIAQSSSHQETLYFQGEHSSMVPYLDGFRVTPAPTPEPGSIVLLATGLAGMAATLRRRIFS